MGFREGRVSLGGSLGVAGGGALRHRSAGSGPPTTGPQHGHCGDLGRGRPQGEQWIGPHMGAHQDALGHGGKGVGHAAHLERPGLTPLMAQARHAP